MPTKSERKRELILDRAKQVFIRRGFNGVTMKDIIAECEISRGGVYVYFSSVDEVFVEVINRHNQAKLAEVKQTVKENTDFEAVLDDYFHMQKERLLHMEDSLLLAMFEFYIANKHNPDKDFFSGTFNTIINVITKIIDHGVNTGHVKHGNAAILANNILYCIKGLETQAMSYGVSEELIDMQFGFYKELIFKREGQSGQ